ncbi:hypothetical protein ACUOA5_40965, partial [Escherichia coli]
MVNGLLQKGSCICRVSRIAGDDGGRIRIHNGALNEHWCDGQEYDEQHTCNITLLSITPVFIESAVMNPYSP